MEHGLSRYTNERCRCATCKAANATYMREYRARDPLARLKHRARALLEAAVKRGDIVPQPCEECGDVHVQAHHDDYAKPLDVRWFCRSHHRRRDREVSSTSRGCSPLVRVAAA